MSCRVCCIFCNYIETLCAVVCTPECQAQAEETEAAEAVEDFHVEVTDYIVQLCLAT